MNGAFYRHSKATVKRFIYYFVACNADKILYKQLIDIPPYVCLKGVDELRVYAMLFEMQINCLSMLND